MASPPVARRPLSVIEAMQQAIELTGKRLFPFRLERWLPLGFVTFLDRCGREGGGGTNFQVPGGVGDGDAASVGGPDLSEAREWFLAHLAVILAVGAIVLVFTIGFVALILWINSRGVFMYLDNVATGRFDVVRPWKEHADAAWSYFGWSFGLAMTGFFGVLLLLMAAALPVIELFSTGAAFGPIATILAVGVAFLLFVIILSLFSILLRDFAAPLQLALGIRCGAALRVAWGLVKANVLVFVAYVALKIVFAIAAAILTFVTGCLTCCLGFLPVIHHTLLQPVYYFERAWSLALLDQAGYDVFPAPPPPPAPAAPAATA